MTEGYPLFWPPGWKRNGCTGFSKFGDHSFSAARHLVLDELRLLKAQSIIISTNIPLREDGMPYANRSQPADKGVAVYFKLAGNDVCIPCDKWNKIEHNLYAIAKTVGALRGIERWGAKEMVTAAFRGFQALPDYSNTNYFPGVNDLTSLEEKYKQIAKKLHPDAGGNKEDFAGMSNQYQAIKKALVVQE